MKDFDDVFNQVKQYKEEFYNTFKVSINRFADTMFAVYLRKYNFNIIAFDSYLKTQGYNETSHGSMKDYITKIYGLKACQLIEKLNKK